MLFEVTGLLVPFLVFTLRIWRHEWLCLPCSLIVRCSGSI